jgi:hypothetical protein
VSACPLWQFESERVFALGYVVEKQDFKMVERSGDDTENRHNGLARLFRYQPDLRSHRGRQRYHPARKSRSFAYFKTAAYHSAGQLGLV